MIARRTVLLGLLAAGAVFPLAFAVDEDSLGSFAQPGDPPGPQMGDDAYALRLRAYNEDIAIKLTSTADVALHDFVGVAAEHPRKAVVIHFFSVAHKRSVKDLAMLQKLFRRYEDDGLLILGISVDSEQTELVFSAIDEHRLAYPVLRDRFGIVARRYGLRHLPTIYIVDAEGKVASVREGYIDDIAEVLETEVKELIKR